MTDQRNATNSSRCRKVALQLLSDLKSGKARVVGIDQVREVLLREFGRVPGPVQDWLEQTTLRYLVSSA